ncbi:zinc-ribbon domain-containing protein [Sulfitobacter sp. R86518]|uniref:zinc-ribbon domain-containing protein n=1 Tax=Sulfitobacter sp. R86518 TaxID=3093858 RepID=UPI0036DD4888
MRLICPNCDAQYEVPDEVMPSSGRDVQCSNCGQTWFQHHPDFPPLDEEDDGRISTVSAALSARDDADDGVAREGDADAPAPASPPEPDEDAAEDPDAGEPAHPAPPPRKQLDPSVADILRQEAEAEQEARRRRQAETLESQPDLGLEEADQPSESERAQQAKARMSRLRGEEQHSAAETTAAAAAVASRRELLPDIEEINSTLRTGSERRVIPNMGADAGRDTHVDPKQRSGFSRGFVLIVALASVLVLLYVFSPQISEAVPALRPYLALYVAQVDSARQWLDEMLQSTLQWLDARASQSGS